MILDRNNLTGPGEVIMNNNAEPTQILAPFLEGHLDEISADWSERIYQNASFHPDDRWRESLLCSTAWGLKAIIDALTTGSYDPLQHYLVSLTRTSLRSGFESGEVSESILLCKEAVLAALRSAGVLSCDGLCDVIAELDTCLRRAIGYFVTIYDTEVSRRIQNQHEHIMAMLKLSEKPAETLEIDEILDYVAQALIDSIEVDHCDFYLVSDDQQHLIPKLGVSRFPQPAERVEAFLNHPPDKTSDVFLQQVMEQKEPLVCDNAAIDSRVAREIAGPMKTKSILALPLVSHQKVFAIANTGTFTDYRAFTAEQIEMARDIARAATLLIENTRLHQQTRYLAVLEERDRLAREIHDDIAQVLSILSLQASYVEELLRNGQTEQAQTFLAAMKKTAAEGNIDAREAIFSLRHGPSSAAEFLPMLQAHVERYHKLYGIDVHLDIQEAAIMELSASAVNQLPRIIQEALTNVRKHANADSVWVRMQTNDDDMTVCIEDNGRGFVPEELQKQDRSGIGLQVMRERAESLGGTLRIDSQVDRGTRIVAHIPPAGSG